MQNNLRFFVIVPCSESDLKDRGRDGKSDKAFPLTQPSPLGRGRGEGEGIRLSFTAFFSAVGSGLNSTENGEEPTGISLVDDGKASSSFVEQPASAAGRVLLGERAGLWVGVRGNEANSNPRRT